MIKPASATGHEEAWKAYVKTYEDKYQTLGNWLVFLAGWEAKARLFQIRRVRGV